MASGQNTHVLTEDDLSYWENEDPPEIRAARNPDSSVLLALLDHAPTTSRRNYSANAFVPGHVERVLETPLTAAIKAQLPDNVRALLSHGADPDGYPLHAMAEYAGIFLRFRDQCSLIHAPREEILEQIHMSQTVPITDSEIESRSRNICRFWKGADSVLLDCYKGGDGMTALEEACKHKSTTILEMILSSSRDMSFWTDVQTDIPQPATPSSLSVSNPLICAVKYGQTHHLRRLLDLGFNPNSTPLACRQQSYPPLMATLICCDPPNWDAFSLLLAHPATDRNQLTPLTKVHLLHVTVSLLSLSILKHVLQSGFSLSTAVPTAAGHTLLHIACLPLNITHVNIFQESIYNSAHEFRQLGSSRMPDHIIFDDDTPRPQPTDWFAMQTELVLYLLSQSPDPDALIAAQDCHGNTAFHYLAMHRTVNEELLNSLMSFSENSEDVYYEAKNRWDWTADNLIRHGEVAEIDVSKKYWKRPYAARTTEGGAVIPYE